MGRPTDYTEELGINICTQIAEGKALTTICKAEDMPALRSVYYWLNANEEFLHTYTRAKEDQADTLVDEMLAIADEKHNDTYVDDNGNERTDGDVIQRSRLRVETRKWIASKLKAKKYGDKQTTELVGKDGGAIQTETKLDVTPLNDDQLRAIASISIKRD